MRVPLVTRFSALCALDVSICLRGKSPCTSLVPVRYQFDNRQTADGLTELDRRFLPPQTHLDLMNREVEKGVLVPHRDEALRSHTAHGRAQASVEL